MATSSIQAYGGSAINGGVNINDFRTLSFVYPNEHVPFAVFDPANDPFNTSVTVPKPGKTFKYIDFEVTDDDLWDRISEVVADGYLPVLRNSGYNYLPYDSEPSGRMIFATFYSVNTVSFIQVTSNNSIVSMTRAFDITYSITTGMSAQECVEYIHTNIAGYLIMMLDTSTGTLYPLVSYKSTTNTETWKFRTADGTGYDLVYDNTDPDNVVYTLTPVTADAVWAHFVNGTYWTEIDDRSEYTLDGPMSWSEGDMVPHSYPIALQSGIYRFSIELALMFPTASSGQSNFDLRIYRGSQELRAMTFDFNASWGNGVIQTKWCGGVFKMTSAGNLNFTLEYSNGTFANARAKVSHVFLNKI